MITEVISITSSGENMDAALDLSRKTAAYNSLSPKSTLQLRLLAEEMMGIMRSITGETKGKFWIEAENGVYQLHLVVDAALTREKRDQLLATASSGRNDAARSFMGRLREFFFGRVDEEIAAYDNTVLAGGVMPDGSRPMTDWEWRMTRYQDALSAAKAEKTEAADAWDELEKSVVSNVADDVKVSIKGFQTEMTIIKKMA